MRVDALKLVATPARPGGEPDDPREQGARAEAAPREGCPALRSPRSGSQGTRLVVPSDTDVAALVHGTQDAAYATDAQGCIQGWNTAAERLLGYASQRVLGRSCGEVVCVTDLSGRRRCDQHCALVDAVGGRGAPRRLQTMVTHASGERLRVRLSGLGILCGEEPAAIIHLVHPVGELGEDLPPAPLVPYALLTPREQQVLREVARGARNREVAETLSITEATVRSHMRNVLRKLEVRGRLEAVARVFGRDTR